MTDSNPYQYTEESQDDDRQRVHGCWRRGKRLIVERDFVLPSVCIRCGRPAPYRVPWRLRPVQTSSLISSSGFLITLTVGLFVIVSLFAWPIGISIYFWLVIPVTCVLALVLLQIFQDARRMESERDLEVALPACGRHFRLWQARLLPIMGFFTVMLASSAGYIEFSGSWSALIIAVALSSSTHLLMPFRLGVEAELGKRYAVSGCGAAFLETLPADSDDITAQPMSPIRNTPRTDEPRSHPNDPA